MFIRTCMVLGAAVLLSAGFANAQTSAGTSLMLQASLAAEHHDGVVGKAFVLDGTRSTDDGTVGTYSWKQISGPFKFSLETGAKISVTPSVAGTYVFELVVTDRAGSSSVVKKIELSVSAAASAATGVGTVAAPPPPPQEASDMFLKIDTIEGESSESKKGNVEMNWKVEEGESAKPAENDRLINTGPRDDWPKGGVSIAVGDVNGLTEEEKQERLAGVKEWAEIKSGQDLQNFATGVLLKDVQMKGAKIQENLIEVDYAMPAKLFGVFSVEYAARVSINRGENENWDFGRVKVRFPWYSFLLRKGVSADELANAVKLSPSDPAEVEADAVADTAGKKEGGKDTIELDSWSFGKAAQVFQQVSNVLKTRHDTAKNSIGNIR